MTKEFCFSRLVAVTAVLAVLAGCASTGDDAEMAPVSTPTVDYIERLDVYSAPHRDSFLNQLAMNYRSYAIYNARTSNYPEVGEFFAQKAVAAFSGELPFPETLENWPIDNQDEAFELYTAYNDLVEQLKNDASDSNPALAAEMQAKYDCWLSAAASGQYATAEQCRSRFVKALKALRDCTGGRVVTKDEKVVTTQTVSATKQDVYYPDTRNLSSARSATQPRDGVIIVNNVNIPEHLINPVPVQPLTFNQNIYGAGAPASGCDCAGEESCECDEQPVCDCQKNEEPCECDERPVCDCQNNEKPCECQATAVESECACQKKNCSCSDNSQPVNVWVQEKQDIPQPVNVSFQEKPETAQPINVVVNEKEQAPFPDVVTRDEFIGMMADMRADQKKPETAQPINVVVNEKEQAPFPDVVTREEFVDMMMAMRAELKAINDRLDRIQSASGEKTTIKVQQIPLEPQQHIMEEVFEVRFDFDKATIKPEYKDIIEKLSAATQENKNIKVTVIGHTDTMGSNSYNYALGGRRAEAVQKMLVKYGIPASQIVAVSAGEEDLAVPTGDNVPNAENRRVKVIKEIPYTEEVAGAPVTFQITQKTDE